MLFTHVGMSASTLCLLSFSIDYHWACNRIDITDRQSLSGGSYSVSAHAPWIQPGKAVSDKERSALFHLWETYTVCSATTCVFTLCSSSYRAAHDYLQRSHVPGGHVPSRRPSFLGLMFLHLARTSGSSRYCAAGYGPIRPSLSYFIT